LNNSLPEGYVALAQVMRPQGLKGDLKIHLLCSGIERLQACADLKIFHSTQGLISVAMTTAAVRPDGYGVIHLKEVTNRSEAEKLREAFLVIQADQTVSLAADTFFIHDLLGLQVETIQGEDLGIVTEMLELPANWVFLVQKGNQETLIPSLKSMIRHVDLKKRKMIVALPEFLEAQ
jgi:16S rRNA processing protein RimM